MSYTLAEAAAACGINRSTVLRALKRGSSAAPGMRRGHGT